MWGVVKLCMHVVDNVRLCMWLSNEDENQIRLNYGCYGRFLFGTFGIEALFFASPTILMDQFQIVHKYC